MNTVKSIGRVAIVAAAFLIALTTAGNAAAQRAFPSADDAVAQLRTAAAHEDRAALREIFGPLYDSLLTGDRVEDSLDLHEFKTAMAQMCNPVKRGDDTVELNVGAENWPFPIPLTRANDAWTFNTAAGRQEIVNRNVGEDELNAIAVCRAYVQAQREYFSTDHDGSGVMKYARRFRSAQGKRDGLYWEPASDTEELSPFGPLIADAQAEGYSAKPLTKHRRPYHGYFFKILTAQGPDAPGGAYDYVVNGNMIAGFAMVAYPAQWGESGVMSFIIGRQGTLYQSNLGPQTVQRVDAMETFNPDSAWTVVQPRDTTTK